MSDFSEFQVRFNLKGPNTLETQKLRTFFPAPEHQSIAERGEPARRQSMTENDKTRQRVDNVAGYGPGYL